MPGAFINLPRAFGTVDHSVLVRKIELNRVIGINKAWFKSYLLQRKQYIQIDVNKRQTFNL